MAKMVLGWQVTYAEDSPRSYREHVDVITHISPCWYSMDAQGEIKSEEEADTVRVARSTGTTVVPLIVNEKFSPEVAHEILMDEDTRRRAAKNIASLVLDRNFDGINMDLEGAFLKGDRDKYTLLIAELARLLKPHGKHLSVDVVSQTAPPSPEDTGWAQAYDYPGLARHVDSLILMGYDYSWAGGPPGPVSPLWWLKKVLDYTLSCVPKEKVVVGLPFYGRHWVIEGGRPSQGRGVGILAASEILAQPGLHPAWDEEAACPVIRFYEDDKEHVIFYEDLESLRLKLRLVKEYGIDGVAFWRLGMEDPRTWTVVREEFLV